MIGKKQILEDIEYSQTFKNIAETYQEIAASRMQKIRNTVLASREFLLGLNTAYQQVKISYKKDFQRIMKKKGIKNITNLSFINRNGKTLYVFISANTGLYGDLIRRTFYSFLKEFNKDRNADVAIIGRVGARIFKEYFPRKQFLYFDLSDSQIDHEGIKKILPSILAYKKTIVFYEQFQSIITSVPIATSLSGDILPWENTQGKDVKYIFEPSLEEVMMYFEKEITLALFEQIIYESQLAKFASRMVALEETTENIKTKIKKSILKRELIKHQEQNKKQNERIETMKLWR